MSKIITLSEAASIALHGMVLVAKTDHKLNVNQIAEVIDSSSIMWPKYFNDWQRNILLPLIGDQVVGLL